VRPRPAFVAAVVAVAGTLAAGCSVNAAPPKATPTCNVHQSMNVLVLEAQSVPTAERVPCVATLPAGWRIAGARVRSGRSEFVLSNDRAGARALVVHLDARCDTTGATEVPSDELGARRYERIESVSPGFSSVRYYTFAGGCISYRFNLSPRGRALVDEVSLAVGSARRAQLADILRHATHGHVTL